MGHCLFGAFFSLLLFLMIMWLKLPACWVQLLLHHRAIFPPPVVYIFCIQVVRYAYRSCWMPTDFWPHNLLDPLFVVHDWRVLVFYVDIPAWNSTHIMAHTGWHVFVYSSNPSLLHDIISQSIPLIHDNFWMPVIIFFACLFQTYFITKKSNTK